MRSRGPLKDLKDSKLILNESKLFPWSSRISLVPFRTFRRPLFPKPVTGQELFFVVSYSKPALKHQLISEYARKIRPWRHPRKIRWHPIKIWVDFTGYPSNHFSGCRLNGWLSQSCGRNWVFCSFSSFNQQGSAKHQNRRRPSHSIWFWIPFAPITFSFTTLVPKKRQLFELKMQFIISFKFYLFCRIGTIAIVHWLVLEFQTLK